MGSIKTSIELGFPLAFNLKYLQTKIRGENNFEVFVKICRIFKK